MVCWVDCAVSLRMGVWIKTGRDAVSLLFMRSMMTGLLLALQDGMICSSFSSMPLLVMAGDSELLKVWRGCNGALDGATG